MKTNGKLKKILSTLLVTALLFTTVPAVVSSAASKNLGINIDEYSQAYINDLNGNWSESIRASLTSDSAYTNGGQALKLSYTNQGDCASFISSEYWNYGVSTAGYEGIKFWVYNDSQDTVAICMVLADAIYSAVQDSRFYLKSDESGHFSPRNTSKVYTTNWGDNLGETGIPAGFKGFVYLPFTSLANTPETISTYRFHIFNVAGNAGDLYYDDFSLYTETINSLTAGGEIDFYNDAYISELNTGWAESGMQVSLTSDPDYTNGGQALALTYSHENACASFANGDWITTLDIDGFTGIKFWIYNPSANNMKFIMIPENNARVYNGAVYYKKNQLTGIVSTETVNSVEWYTCGIIDIEAGFKGFIYIPFTSMNNTPDGPFLSTVGTYRFHVSDDGNDSGTFYYDDFMLYREAINPVAVGGNIDSYTSAYVNEVNGGWNGASIGLTNEDGLTAGGQSLHVTYTYGDQYGRSLSYANGDIHYGGSLAGSEGISFWVYNPKATAISLVMIPNHDLNQTLQRGVPYYIKDIATGHVTEKTTICDNSQVLYGVGFGEIIVEGGFKGWVYIPMTSFMTTPTSIGTYRMVVLSPDATGGEFYYDALQSYTEDSIFTGGDVNIDGMVDIKDLVRLKKVSSLTSAATKASDIDGNGSINGGDLILMKKYILAK